ncbi:MAG: futalosine hydrolase [Bacteroidota bacterium]
MKILIVAATRFEVQPLLIQMESVRNFGSTLISCNYKKLEINFLITGVGMVATAYHLGKNLSNGYDLALNIGICGSFNRNLAIGSVVNVYEDCFSELGAEDGDSFLSLEELELAGVSKLSNINFQISNSIIEMLPKVNGITVNTVHGNENSIKKAVQKFHPIVESMEGGAFMFACENEELQHTQIRAVSNYVEHRNKEIWNIPLAIENLNVKILEILDSYV